MSDQSTSLFSTGPGPDSTGIVPGFGGSNTQPLDRTQRRELSWNGGADLGLLLLRFAVGGVFLAHGAQKMFGMWGGEGIGAFTRALEGFGFRYAGLLAWVTSAGELAAGAAVVLGLFTPLAAAGLLAVAINGVLLNLHNGVLLAASPTAVEYEIVLGAAAAALVLTGPGRIALDRGRTWHRRPAPWGVLCLVIGVAAGLLVFFLLRAR